MVDDVSRRKLTMNVLHRDAHIHHQHHHVVCKVCDLVDRLLLVVSLARDNHLGAFLAHLLEYLIPSLFEKVGGIRSLGAALVSAHKKIVKPLEVLFI